MSLGRLVAECRLFGAQEFAALPSRDSPCRMGADLPIWVGEPFLQERGGKGGGIATRGEAYASGEAVATRTMERGLAEPGTKEAVTLVEAFRRLYRGALVEGGMRSRLRTAIPWADFLADVATKGEV